jgi:hypothetical protein
VQPNQDQADQELLALAQETERVAATIADPTCALRLTEIAGEVRSMASWLRHTGDKEVGSWTFRPVA